MRFDREHRAGVFRVRWVRISSSPAAGFVIVYALGEHDRWAPLGVGDPDVEQLELEDAIRSHEHHEEMLRMLTVVGMPWREWEVSRLTRVLEMWTALPFDIGVFVMHEPLQRLETLAGLVRPRTPVGVFEALGCLVRYRQRSTCEGHWIKEEG